MIRRSTPPLSASDALRRTAAPNPANRNITCDSSAEAADWGGRVSLAATPSPIAAAVYGSRRQPGSLLHQCREGIPKKSQIVSESTLSAGAMSPIHLADDDHKN